MKTCSACTRQLPLSDFADKRRDGLPFVARKCSACRKPRSNGDRVRSIVYNANHRARKFGVLGVLAVSDWLSAAASNRCHYCGIPKESNQLTLDHRQPMARGGTNTPSNIAAVCSMCNSSKGNKTEAEYLETIKGYIEAIRRLYETV